MGEPPKSAAGWEEVLEKNLLCGDFRRENGIEHNGERNSQNGMCKARQRKAWVGKTGCAGQREDLKLDTQTRPSQVRRQRAIKAPLVRRDRGSRL